MAKSRKYELSNPELNQRTTVKEKSRGGKPVKLVRKTYQLDKASPKKGKRIQKEVINLKKHTKKVKGNYGTVLPAKRVTKVEAFGGYGR